jgi:hypothetical protein
MDIVGSLHIQAEAEVALPLAVVVHYSNNSREVRFPRLLLPTLCRPPLALSS